MASGIEIAGVILATFPLLISGIEHYENGFQPIKEWIRFRGEFATFMNALIRQKIFFRQNIEDLLSPIISSEYEMSLMLDHPGGSAWSDNELNDKLRRRLPGKYEYESYTTTVSYILETLEKLKAKLKVSDDQPVWAEQPTAGGKLRLEYEMKRIMYTFSRKRRDKLMSRLEKHNKEIQDMLGNIEKLEPMRKKRKSPITKYFHRIRSQAQSLHTALTRAWQCGESSAHSAKLLLETRVRSDENGGPEIEDPTTIKFNVFFCHLRQESTSTLALLSSPSDWCAAEIEMMGCEQDLERAEPLYIGMGSRSSLLEASSQHQSNLSSRGSSVSGPMGRKVSFLESETKSSTLSVLGDAPEISNLCSVLQNRLSHQSPLGYLKDPQERRHSLSLIDHSQISFSEMQRVLSLDEVLGSKDDASGVPTLPRRTRLAIAVIVANSMLQLHTGPWLCEAWGKRDIYFLQGRDGAIHTKHPFLICHFSSHSQTLTTDFGNVQIESSATRPCNSSLLSLGILILELWFNQKIESQPFRSRFQGPDGKDNEYTNFNTAQKWQEQAMEEAGLELHNPTRRCIYCAFGAVSQDLEDDDLRRAVYSEVVQPLEKLLKRFEGRP
ncbi:MAG: hypothetical protein Q9164_004845 [Protoblastenia rupestris]